MNCELKKNNLKKKSAISFDNNDVNCEKVIKCLNKLPYNERRISIENLSLYRLESLIRVIAIKKIMFDRINLSENAHDRIKELEIQLENYTNKANFLIKEIVKSGKIQTSSLQ